jgi:hypothetical protein
MIAGAKRHYVSFIRQTDPLMDSPVDDFLQNMPIQVRLSTEHYQDSVFQSSTATDAEAVVSAYCVAATA